MPDRSTVLTICGPAASPRCGSWSTIRKDRPGTDRHAGLDLLSAAADARAAAAAAAAAALAPGLRQLSVSALYCRDLGTEERSSDPSEQGRDRGFDSAGGRFSSVDASSSFAGLSDLALDRPPIFSSPGGVSSSILSATSWEAGRSTLFTTPAREDGGAIISSSSGVQHLLAHRGRFRNSVLYGFCSFYGLALSCIVVGTARGSKPGSLGALEGHTGIL